MIWNNSAQFFPAISNNLKHVSVLEQDINRDSTTEKNSVVRLEETERYEEMVRFQQDGDDGGGAGRKCLIINQTKATTCHIFLKNLSRVLGKVVLLQLI